MCRSSELSISSSIPVILPARFECMVWMSGNKRSPAGRHSSENQVRINTGVQVSTRLQPPPLQARESLTQHLLLFLGGCCGQHGGGQGLLPLHVDCRLGCLGTRRGSWLAPRKGLLVVIKSVTIQQLKVYYVKEEAETVTLAVKEQLQP